MKVRFLDDQMRNTLWPSIKRGPFPPQSWFHLHPCFLLFFFASLISPRLAFFLPSNCTKRLHRHYTVMTSPYSNWDLSKGTCGLRSHLGLFDLFSSSFAHATSIPLTSCVHSPRRIIRTSAGEPRVSSPILPFHRAPEAPQTRGVASAWTPTGRVHF